MKWLIIIAVFTYAMLVPLFMIIYFIPVFYVFGGINWFFAFLLSILTTTVIFVWALNKYN